MIEFIIVAGVAGIVSGYLLGRWQSREELEIAREERKFSERVIEEKAALARMYQRRCDLIATYPTRKGRTGNGTALKLQRIAIGGE